MPIIKTYASNEEAYRELKNVEYLQSSGTQWINTGYYPSDKTKIKIKLINKLATGGNIIGNNINDNNSLRFFNYSNNFYLDYGNGNGNRIYGGNFLLNTIYELEIGNRYVKDLTTGINIISSSQVSFSRKDFDIKISTQTEKNVYYYVKIYDNDILVRDYQPVVLNDVGYLYDKVEHKLYGNDGTGAFTYGSILDITINPQDSGYVDRDIIGGKLSLTAIANQGYEFENWLLKGYTQLEYIESTGTQYINTGVIPNNKKIEIDTNLAITSNNNVFALFGISYVNSAIGHTTIRTNDSSLKTFIDLTGVNDWNIGNNLTLNEFYDINWTIDGSNSIISGDLSSNITNSNFSSGNFRNGTIQLFGINTRTDILAKMRLSKSIIKIDNNIVRDYIPVIRHSDGAIGLLDLCEMKFYGNSGTGEFIGGNAL